MKIISKKQNTCVPWLTCSEIKKSIKLKKSNLIGQGMTKKVYIAEYLGQIVTVSVRNSAYPERQQDFVDNIENLQKMNNLKIRDENKNFENKAINFLGSCNN